MFIFLQDNLQYQDLRVQQTLIKLTNQWAAGALFIFGKQEMEEIHNGLVCSQSLEGPKRSPVDDNTDYRNTLAAPKIQAHPALARC